MSDEPRRPKFRREIDGGVPSEITEIAHDVHQLAARFERLLPRIPQPSSLRDQVLLAIHDQKRSAMWFDGFVRELGAVLDTEGES